MERKIWALLAVWLLLFILLSACFASGPADVVPSPEPVTPSQEPPATESPDPSVLPSETPSPPDNITPSPSPGPDVTESPPPDDITPSPSPGPDVTESPPPDDNPSPEPSIEPTPGIPAAESPDPTPAATPTQANTTPSPVLTPEPSPVLTPEPSPVLTPEPSPVQTRSSYTISMPAQPGTSVSENEKAVVDYSNTKDGYVSIKYLQSSETAYVWITTPKGNKIQYNLKTDGRYEVFPLSEGNGSYSIDVLQMVPDSTQASRALPTVTIEVSLTDQLRPFLRPNLYVNYSKDSQAVKKAAELTKNNVSDIDAVASVYNYIISNITYDKSKAATVTKGYTPNVDTTLKDGKGICFDYAALMTAMLRSQGIPTKLEIGNAGTEYHAWISVYTKENGWVNNIIQFESGKWRLMDPTFASSKKDYTGSEVTYKLEKTN